MPSIGTPQGVVTSARGAGGTVTYALAGPDVAEPLGAARRFLTEILAGQVDLPDEYRAATAGPDRRQPTPGTAHRVSDLGLPNPAPRQPDTN